MQAHILTLHTLGPWGGVTNVQKLFSQSSHVAYVIKEKVV